MGGWKTRKTCIKGSSTSFQKKNISHTIRFACVYVRQEVLISNPMHCTRISRDLWLAMPHVRWLSPKFKIFLRKFERLTLTNRGLMTVEADRLIHSSTDGPDWLSFTE